MSLAITPALAEIATLGKRITKRRESIQPYPARHERVKDPQKRRDPKTPAPAASHTKSPEPMSSQLVRSEEALDYGELLELAKRPHPGLEDGFEFTGGPPVAVPARCARPRCDLCDEPMCVWHGKHFADCPCPGPDSAPEDGWAVVSYPDGLTLAWPVRPTGAVGPRE